MAKVLGSVEVIKGVDFDIESWESVLVGPSGQQKIDPAARLPNVHLSSRSESATSRGNQPAASRNNADEISRSGMVALRACKLFAVGFLLGDCLAEAAPVRTEASSGMVATAKRLGSEVGVNILKEGGNAIDAAVAVGYALAVVLPCCGNIGGAVLPCFTWRTARRPSSTSAKRNAARPTSICTVTDLALRRCV